MNAMRIPVTFAVEVCALKNTTPVMITKTGVSVLSVPASALSIFPSAMQNKNAGIKLPILPDKKISKRFLGGIRPMYFMVVGNKINPDDTIRKAATW